MYTATGGDALVDALCANGIDTLFALPGGQLDHLFDAAFRQGDRIRLIHSRHEQGVAYMAYGYARSTGRVGAYAVVPGPGLLNSSAALCTAWANYTSVLALSGQIPMAAIDRGYGELQEIPDQLGMIAHITKWAHRITHPALTSDAVNSAFTAMKTGAPRPVELEMPMDVMGMPAAIEHCVPAAESTPLPVDAALIEQACELLVSAKKPLIYVGSGAIDAAPAIRELAENLQAPVVSFRSGKGILSAEHYLEANFPMGHRLWGDADLVLAIGTRLHWPLTMWGKDKDLKLIRIDVDPEQVALICDPDIALVGNSTAVVPHLVTAVAATGHSAVSREDELLTLKAEVNAEIRTKVAPQMAYLDVIRDELPRDGFFVDEVTQVGFVSWYGFPVYAPRHFISAGYQGTLGYGFATALGVVAGNPGKRVIQVSGDGGFMFNVQELSTAVQYQLPLVTVIFNDSRFTNVQRQQVEWFDGRVTCSDLHNPDFVALAESFGAVGLRADSPESVRSCIRQAFEESGPVIIEVKVDEFFPAPWPFLMMPQNRDAVCR
ncbi:MAG: thiamine pyrophosphate-binding protein [Pseudomonadales bacterium]